MDQTRTTGGLLILVRPPTGIKALATVGGSNRDWRATFSPGWTPTGTEGPLLLLFCKGCASNRWAGDFSPGWYIQPGQILYLVLGPKMAGTKDSN
jgi:hypothetical protein